MSKKQYEEVKKRLLYMKTQILNSGFLRSSDDLQVSSDDLPDEADLANNVISQQVTFNIRHRELEKLRMIEEALYKIEEGTYGVCEECDEPIGDKRLEKNPWTSLCITHAEERERENKRFSASAKVAANS